MSVLLKCLYCLTFAMSALCNNKDEKKREKCINCKFYAQCNICDANCSCYGNSINQPYTFFLPVVVVVRGYFLWDCDYFCPRHLTTLSSLKIIFYNREIYCYFSLLSSSSFTMYVICNVKVHFSIINMITPVNHITFFKCCTVMYLITLSNFLKN